MSNEKKLQDFLHLYLSGNAQVEYDGRIGNIFTYYHPAGKFNTDQVWICSLEEDGNPEMSCSAPVDKVKLLLRPLSSMTEEEITELFLLKGMTKPDKVTRTEIKDRFLQIEYIHSGVYGSDYQHIITMYPDQFAYLLSKSFDLFGLIDAGLAIDSTKHPSK